MLSNAYLSGCSIFNFCSKVAINYCCQDFVVKFNMSKLVAIDPWLLWGYTFGLICCRICLVHVHAQRHDV